MEQIRARIREKRGVDYTEQQIRELAAVKLEKFLDPRGVRSDLLDQFRKAQPTYEPPELPNFAFEDATLFESHRGADPVDPQAADAAAQAAFQPEPADSGAPHPVAPEHDQRGARRAARGGAAADGSAVRYELVHNLVVETTRHGHRGQEPEDARRGRSRAGWSSTSSARARARSAVVYKPAEPTNAAVQRAPAPHVPQPPAAAAAASSVAIQPPPQRVRQAGSTSRRRRAMPQRHRRGARTAATSAGHGWSAGPATGPGQRSRRAATHADDAAADRRPPSWGAGAGDRSHRRHCGRAVAIGRRRWSWIAMDDDGSRGARR